MALLRARARDGVLDMPPDVHDPKEADIADLAFAACARLRARTTRVNPNATENQYSQMILHFRHLPKR
jgi:hypothetical protein